MDSKVLAIGSLVTSGVALIFAAYGASKMIKAAKKLECAVDDIAEDIDIDIPDSIVEEATNKAVEKAADHAAQITAAKITHEFDDTIRAEVHKAINKERESMKSEIKDHITKKIGYIDISDIQEEVKNEAKSEVAERLKGDLDGITASYNEQLNNIKTIYSSIAKDMKGAAI